MTPLQRAYHSATTPDILAELAGDVYACVREGIALHPSTPPEVLALLAGDESEDVRRGVAENPAAPANVRAVLVAAADADELARRARDEGWCRLRAGVLDGGDE